MTKKEQFFFSLVVFVVLSMVAQNQKKKIILFSFFSFLNCKFIFHLMFCMVFKMGTAQYKRWCSTSSTWTNDFSLNIKFKYTFWLCLVYVHQQQKQHQQQVYRKWTHALFTNVKRTFEKNRNTYSKREKIEYRYMVLGLWECACVLCVLHTLLFLCNKTILVLTNYRQFTWSTKEAKASQKRK